MTIVDSWGNNPWDTVPFNGGTASSTLQLLGASAEAENVIRLQFSAAVYYSGILDGADASQPTFYVVAAVAGTTGNDGNPARTVNVVSVTQPIVATGLIQGAYLDLELDRPMTPYPAQYRVTTQGVLYSQDKTQKLLAGATAQLYATYRVLTPVVTTALVPGRDFANPQTGGQATASTIDNPAVAALGSFGYSADGDYAIDSREDGLRKRLWRRTISKPGAFLHLGLGYGVGVQTFVKKLGRGSTRDQLAGALESNYTAEPEVASARVQAVNSATSPNLVRLRITIVKRGQGKPANFTMDVPSQ